ncbi:MAG: extracellular solute-binding protein [Oscillospiraceae bacterium]
MKLRLAQLQMSDQAPDIYVVGNQDYPTMLFRDQFEALDEHIKLDAPEWNGVKEAIGKYKYNGKHYILNSGNRVSRMIWWNSNIFNEMGCKDTPESLMQKGKWDWDTMQRLAEETTDIKNGIYGFGYMYSLSWAYQASAGENLVTMTGDGVINNTDSPNIAKAMDAFSKISTNKILYQNDSNPQQAFANGKIAMYFDTCEMGGADNIRAQVNNGTIKLAHFPKMPGAESYVYSGEFNGYAIPKGAKNIDCAVAFLAMTRAQAAYQDEVKNKYYSDCGFNEYDKKIYEEANKCEFVDNVALGLSDVLEVCKPIEVELKLGAPWSTVKNKCKPKIQAALDSIGS